MTSFTTVITLRAFLPFTFLRTIWATYALARPISWFGHSWLAQGFLQHGYISFKGFNLFSSTLKLLISFRIGFSFALFLGLFGCSTSGVSKTFTRACLPNFCFCSASLFAARINFSNKTSSDTLISFKYGSLSALMHSLSNQLK